MVWMFLISLSVCSSPIWKDRPFLSSSTLADASRQLPTKSFIAVKVKAPRTAFLRPFNVPCKSSTSFRVSLTSLPARLALSAISLKPLPSTFAFPSDWVERIRDSVLFSTRFITDDALSTALSEISILCPAMFSLLSLQLGFLFQFLKCLYTFLIRC